MKGGGVVKGRGLIRIKGLTTVTNTMVWDDHFSAKNTTFKKFTAN